jgi:hypothetical protein
MNTIAFLAACFVLGLVVAAKIPGLEHLVRPIIDLVFSAVKVIAEGAFGWTVYLFKALWFAHVELLQHLALTPESIDPTFAIRETSDPAAAAAAAPKK